MSLTETRRDPLDASRADDATLVRRILGGDLVAFEHLMRANNRRLYRLARAALRDDAEAEDALQDAYLAAHSALAGSVVSPRSPRGSAGW